MGNDVLVFKLYGINEGVLKTKCEKIFSESGAKFSVSTQNLDSKVEIVSVESKEFDLAQKKFIETFRSNIYAQSDMGLAETLVFLLKLRKMKMATAESFTGGEVARNVIGVSGASEVFYEGIIAYDSEAKIQRLGVERESIVKDYPVSAQVAGEMAQGLYKSKRIHLAVSTTGIAGPNSDSSEFPVGLCYIGIGVNGDVNVYKYEFEGSREEIIYKGSQTAIFLAVKSIKNI